MKSRRSVRHTYEAPGKSQTNGTHTVSIDEATGLQALERPAANNPAQPSQLERHNVELIGNRDYRRHPMRSLGSMLAFASKGSVHLAGG